MNPEIFKEILDELQMVNMNLSEIASNISNLSDELNELNLSFKNLNMVKNKYANPKTKKK